MVHLDSTERLNDETEVQLADRTIIPRSEDDELCRAIRSDQQAYAVLRLAINARLQAVVEQHRLASLSGVSDRERCEWEAVEARYRKQQVWKEVCSGMHRGMRDQRPDFNKAESEALPASWTVQVSGRPKAPTIGQQQQDEEEEGSEDAVCMCCFDGRSADGNHILFCDGCNAALHQTCYGVGQVPDGDFFCDRCRYVQLLNKEVEDSGLGELGDMEAKTSVMCCLCPLHHGGLKPTTDGRWVHLCCVAWSQDAVILDLTEMSPVDVSRVKVQLPQDQSDANNAAASGGSLARPFSRAAKDNSNSYFEDYFGAAAAVAAGAAQHDDEALRSVADDQFKQLCTISDITEPCCYCNLKGGLVVRCEHNSNSKSSSAVCSKVFHPLCAWFEGQYLRADITDPTFQGLDRDGLFPSGLKFNFLCQIHSMDLAAPTPAAGGDGGAAGAAAGATAVVALAAAGTGGSSASAVELRLRPRESFQHALEEQAKLRCKYRLNEDDLEQIPGQNRRRRKKGYKKKERQSKSAGGRGTGAGPGSTKDLCVDIYDDRTCACCMQPMTYDVFGTGCDPAAVPAEWELDEDVQYTLTHDPTPLPKLPESDIRSSQVERQITAQPPQAFSSVFSSSSSLSAAAHSSTPAYGQATYGSYPNSFPVAQPLSSVGANYSVGVGGAMGYGQPIVAAGNYPGHPPAVFPGFPSVGLAAPALMQAPAGMLLPPFQSVAQHLYGLAETNSHPQMRPLNPGGAINSAGTVTANGAMLLSPGLDGSAMAGPGTNGAILLSPELDGSAMAELGTNGALLQHQQLLAPVRGPQQGAQTEQSKQGANRGPDTSTDAGALPVSVQSAAPVADISTLVERSAVFYPAKSPPQPALSLSATDSVEKGVLDATDAVEADSAPALSAKSGEAVGMFNALSEAETVVEASMVAKMTEVIPISSSEIILENDAKHGDATGGSDSPDNTSSLVCLAGRKSFPVENEPTAVENGSSSFVPSSASDSSSGAILTASESNAVGNASHNVGVSCVDGDGSGDGIGDRSGDGSGDGDSGTAESTRLSSSHLPTMPPPPPRPPRPAFVAAAKLFVEKRDAPTSQQPSQDPCAPPLVPEAPEALPMSSAASLPYTSYPGAAPAAASPATTAAAPAPAAAAAPAALAAPVSVPDQEASLPSASSEPALQSSFAHTAAVSPSTRDGDGRAVTVEHRSPPPSSDAEMAVALAMIGAAPSSVPAPSAVPQASDTDPSLAYDIRAGPEVVSQSAFSTAPIATAPATNTQAVDKNAVAAGAGEAMVPAPTPTIRDGLPVERSLPHGEQVQPTGAADTDGSVAMDVAVSDAPAALLPGAAPDLQSVIPSTTAKATTTSEADATGSGAPKIEVSSADAASNTDAASSVSINAGAGTTGDSSSTALAGPTAPLVTSVPTSFPFLRCSQCRLVIHRRCAQSADRSIPAEGSTAEASWRCDVCAVNNIEDIGQVRCTLCPRRGGYLKRTTDMKWVHPFCALNMPSGQARMLPDGRVHVGAMPRENKKEKCGLCNRKGGCMVQCSHIGCASQFHPLCGARSRKVCTFQRAGEKHIYCNMHLPDGVECLPSGYWIDGEELASLYHGLERARLILDILVRREKYKRMLCKAETELLQLRFNKMLDKAKGRKTTKASKDAGEVDLSDLSLYESESEYEDSDEELEKAAALDAKALRGVSADLFVPLSKLQKVLPLRKGQQPISVTTSIGDEATVSATWTKRNTLRLPKRTIATFAGIEIDRSDAARFRLERQFITNYQKVLVAHTNSLRASTQLFSSQREEDEFGVELTAQLKKAMNMDNSQFQKLMTQCGVPDVSFDPQQASVGGGTGAGVGVADEMGKLRKRLPRGYAIVEVDAAGKPVDAPKGVGSSSSSSNTAAASASLATRGGAVAGSASAEAGSVKRGRGRPPRKRSLSITSDDAHVQAQEQAKGQDQAPPSKRGRPSSVPSLATKAEDAVEPAGRKCKRKGYVTEAVVAEAEEPEEDSRAKRQRLRNEAVYLAAIAAGKGQPSSSSSSSSSAVVVVKKEAKVAAACSKQQKNKKEPPAAKAKPHPQEEEESSPPPFCTYMGRNDLKKELSEGGNLTNKLLKQLTGVGAGVTANVSANKSKSKCKGIGQGKGAGSAEGFDQFFNLSGVVDALDLTDFEVFAADARVSGQDAASSRHRNSSSSSSEQQKKPLYQLERRLKYILNCIEEAEVPEEDATAAALSSKKGKHSKKSKVKRSTPSSSSSSSCSSGSARGGGVVAAVEEVGEMRSLCEEFLEAPLDLLPDYRRYVRRVVSLEGMKEALTRHAYRSMADFAADFYTLLNNAKNVTPQGSQVKMLPCLS